MSNRKSCSKCKIYKLLECFHDHPRGILGKQSYCIDCAGEHKVRESEQSVINYLLGKGFGAIAGRYDARQKYGDISINGLIILETKQGSTKDGYSYNFNFQTQRKKGYIKAQVICLYLPIYNTYHFFNVSDLYFYQNDGSVVSSVYYNTNPKHARKGNHKACAMLNDMIMIKAQDNLVVIDKALEVAQAQNISDYHHYTLPSQTPPFSD